MPRQISFRSSRIETAVSFNETSSPIYWSMVVSHLMLGPVPIVSPYFILPGATAHVRYCLGNVFGEGVRDYPMFKSLNIAERSCVPVIMRGARVRIKCSTNFLGCGR